MVFAMMYIFTYITQSFFNWGKKNGETAKVGDFLPTISPVFLCQLFS